MSTFQLTTGHYSAINVRDNALSGVKGHIGINGKSLVTDTPENLIGVQVCSMGGVRKKG